MRGYYTRSRLTSYSRTHACAHIYPPHPFSKHGTNLHIAPDPFQSTSIPIFTHNPSLPKPRHPHSISALFLHHSTHHQHAIFYTKHETQTRKKTMMIQSIHFCFTYPPPFCCSEHFSIILDNTINNNTTNSRISSLLDPFLQHDDKGKGV